MAKIINVCPCGRDKDFDSCCNKYLTGKEYAKTPEELMRSRYSAFFYGNWKYLVETHHPSTREETLLDALIENSHETSWHRLIVISQKTTPNNHLGKVEFVAFFTRTNCSNSPQQIHEDSDFIFENGRWFYVSGDMLKPFSLGRNDLCWCGSNKKLKKCHG